MRLNKKGFTLVELLAVIVILAVVMLIAVTAVGPLMTKSRKSALGTEGVGMVDAAKTAYQAEQLNNNSKIKPTSDVCFDLKWLYNKNYFEKGSSTDGYTGSVLVDYNSGKYTYNFWISNKVYVFGKAGSGASVGTGVSPNGYDVESNLVVSDGTTASALCGRSSASYLTSAGIVYCTGSSCS